MPLAPLHQPDGMITQVREACGPGRVRVNGVCAWRGDLTLPTILMANASDGLFFFTRPSREARALRKPLARRKPHTHTRRASGSAMRNGNCWLPFALALGQHARAAR